MKYDPDGIIRFLDTEIPKDDLVTALKVVNHFKKQESEMERARAPFFCWEKLEKLEDFLRLLTGEGADTVDDDTAIEYLKSKESK